MKKLPRILILSAIIIFIFTAIITSSVKKPEIEQKIWNNNMVLGDVENATRHYIVYTDLMCPYCNYYAKTILDSEENFEQFIAEHKIAYEVRVTDMLYESSGIENSLPAAEASYCAAKENKFWDFYHTAISSIFDDYYSKGLGNSKTAPKISDMTRDYWKKLGKKAGLSESFESCYDSEETLAEIQENTYKAASVSSGLPYFTFGKVSTGGFDTTWGWEQTEQMLKAGL